MGPRKSLRNPELFSGGASNVWGLRPRTGGLVARIFLRVSGNFFFGSLPQRSCLSRRREKTSRNSGWGGVAGHLVRT